MPAVGHRRTTTSAATLLRPTGVENRHPQGSLTINFTLMNEPIAYRVAQLYDASVPDWPGEIDFYQELAAEAASKGGAVLEVACGTGRVAIRLAQDGVSVDGIDLSPATLDVAREKSAGIPHVCWVEGDMRSFRWARGSRS